MSPKEKIIAWATHDRSFKAGLALLTEYSKLTGVIRALNIQGSTKSNVEMLHYQLMKLAGASEKEWRRLMAAPVLVMEQAPEPTEPMDVEQRQQAIVAIPDDVRKGFRLRDEFPFLRSKDCPSELKILVADLLTTHDNYVRDHDALFATLNDEEIAALSASVVDNYIENRQIWDELVHYKENGKPLGEHPVWERAKRLTELNNLSNAELVRLSKNYPTNISRIKTKLAEEPDSPQTAKRQASLENYTWELEHINKLLGLNG